MKYFNAVMRVAGYASTGILLVMMLLTVADVFLRYAFRRPIIGTTELTEMMMVCLLLALAWCALEGRHVSVNLVMARFAPRVRALVGSITLIIGTGVYVIIAWQGFLASLYSRSFNVKSSMLDVPEFPFILVLVLSLAMLCLAMINLLIQRIVETVKK